VTSVDTVARTRQRLVEEGVEGALKRHHSPASARQRVFDGEAEAKLIALTLSPPPKGRAKWSLRLLEDKVVELAIVDRASDNTIGRTLKKTFLNRIRRSNSSFRQRPALRSWANMEDVLDVYHRPPDPGCPVVCLDETSKQLITETRVPIPAKSERVTRYDYEYRRNGTAKLFMLFAPLEGWRHVEVTDQRTAKDFARILKELSDTDFPNAPKIALVQDNLNTHRPSSLYEAFPAAEARRLVERFEWHYTPRHGSWLNMAESELGVLSSQCLDRRIPDKQCLIDEVAAWEADRNKNHTKADWQFTTGDARVKLKRLYPAF
jgi:hypothetical protein